MESGDREKALAAARALEKRGQMDGAVDLFIRVGAPEEAARILTGARRFLEAAAVLLGDAKPAQAKDLPPERKKHALSAAILLGRGGETATAVEWFVALGERNRAIELLEKTGDRLGAAKLASAPQGRAVLGIGRSAQVHGFGGAAVNAEAARKLEAQGKPDLALQMFVQLKNFGEAGRIAKLLGKTPEAAELFAEGGRPYEAAMCYREVGDTGRFLDNVVRVPRSDPRYRSACVDAVTASAELGTIGFQLEGFLTEFIRQGPGDEREMQAFYLLAKTYENHDLVENAKEALRKILARNPGYRDAKSRLEALENQTAASGVALDQLKTQDASFLAASKSMLLHEAPPLPDLPELPGLPTLGAVTAAPTYGQVTAMPAAPTPSVAPTSSLRANDATVAGSPRAVGRSVSREVEAIASQVTGGGRRSGAGAEPVTGATLFSAGLSQPRPVAPAPAATLPPTGQVSSPVFQAGAVINERYRLDKKIGQGGMAVVFRATDLELSEEIALKVFTQAVEDEQAVLRFKQELKLSRQLHHPNIVRLFDIGVAGGLRYITMELLVGTDLKSKLGRPMDFARGINYLAQACAGLYAAHSKGVIHRDIKPENLFVTKEGVVKVMDFGIAKQSQQSKLTVAGMIAGTPDYMSPEQINNFAAVTPSTDLYSLGITAYQMFTGKVPFEAPDLMPLLMKHVSEKPRPPRELNPAIPLELEKVILKLLEKNPQDRFRDCRELGMALETIRKHMGA